ncbi:hypothetical protein AVEN_144794-1 [Araneus ventricosus]|uniref:Uncharacterized protein n=1 Tax=Araneus ventricosus TaxID=182803 RepID=A0A4Y2MMS5_ARAVE|nr:hypothetical protein AVEN_144794-1 [Araneus ventricosus]
MLPAGSAVRCNHSAESGKEAINGPLQAIGAVTSQSIQNVHFSQHRDDTKPRTKFSIVLCRVSTEKPPHTHKSTLQADAVLQDCSGNQCASM